MIEVAMTREEFKQFVDEVRIELAEELAKKISYDAPVARAVLNRSIHARHVTKQSTVRGPKYAIFVNYGTGPRAGQESYLPPLRPIMEWLRSKGVPPKQLKQQAQAVRYSIMKNGIEANPFIDQILMQDLPRYAKRIIQKKLKMFKQNEKETRDGITQSTFSKSE